MSWEAVLLDTHPSQGLLRQIDALLENQRATWRRFREGEEALAKIKNKVLSDGDARVIVQANPGRRTSIHAKVDPVSVAERPCFLCPENLPPEERGIGRGELVPLGEQPAVVGHVDSHEQRLLEIIG